MQGMEQDQVLILVKARIVMYTVREAKVVVEKEGGAGERTCYGASFDSAGSTDSAIQAMVDKPSTTPGPSTQGPWSMCGRGIGSTDEVKVPFRQQRAQVATGSVPRDDISREGPWQLRRVRDWRRAKW